MRIGEDGLRTLVEAILQRAGSEPEEARTVADHLVRSNLAGHDSHGVGMLPYYMRFLQHGLLAPNTPARLVSDQGPLLMFEGDRGYGQRVGREAMDVAIERCRSTGVVMMSLRNAHHLGRIGTYGEQSIEAGYVSIHFVNVQDHPPLVAPFRGTDARFGTNPVCVAVPGTDETAPLLLDMATSKLALGKVRLHMNQDETVPPDCLLDDRGRPSGDPHLMFRESKRGALLPLGEHKGYGLVLACELLAGILSGGGTIQPGHPRRGAIVNNMLTFVVDPTRLVDSAWMAQELDAIVRHAKDSPPADPAEPVLVAGDPERASARTRAHEGIPVDDTTWNEILEAGESVGLPRSEAATLAAVTSPD